MSTNNYYGFTHAGTQYGTNYTPVAAVPQPSAYTITGQMYSSAATRPSYDQNYSQPQTATNTVPVTYSYNARPQGSTSAAPVSYDPSQYVTQSGTYPYTCGAASSYTNSYSSVVTNYAASALYNQQSNVTNTDNTASTAVYSSGKTGNWNFKKSLKGNKPKMTTKVQQLHYCDVCKISCAGPQTYKEHLEGQRHKKKEAQMKSGAPQSTNKRGHGSGGISLRCELCDVTCTGNDAYSAHIRGAKHQKVVKLHTKLGKPIPSNDPMAVNPNTTNKSVNKTQGPQIPSAAGKIKVLGTPRINFIGGGRLHTTPSGELKEEGLSDAQQSEAQISQMQESIAQSSDQEMDKSDAQPVGHDYVEELRGDDLKSVSFHCKLCDCKFNDPSAKEMHLKGRRHRLQYKKKVDPNLVVDTKPSLKHRKVPDSKDRRLSYKKDAHWNDWYSNRYVYDARHMSPSPHMPPPHLMAPPPPPGFGAFMGSPMMPHFRRPNASSWDDTHIMKKHAEICPQEDELDEIHHVVACTERALKLVSDKIAEDDAASAMNDIIKKELGDELKGTVNNAPSETTEEKSVTDSQTPNQGMENGTKTDDAPQNRILKGLMRVGTLAKGLLLRGDKEVELVVICAEKPTKTMLQRVSDHLPEQLQVVSAAESFEIVMKAHDGGLSVTSTTEPKVTVNVCFTSPLVREENFSDATHAEMVKEPKQMQLLERQKCLNALAALRHAKWFQARVVNMHPCSMIIRLLRDLCRRLPTWSKLSLWAVELLCEKVISSAGDPLTPGEALRHTFEAIASGLLLPGGAGLVDPCEKEPTDALAALTRQEREDITSSAQHALRLIAFRQIYKILGVDPLPQRNRKRRNESTSELDADTDAPKKEKKDETEDINTSTEVKPDVQLEETPQDN